MLGIGTLFKGGDTSKKYSNKLMQLRVLLQFVAIIVLVCLAYFYCLVHTNIQVSCFYDVLCVFYYHVCCVFVACFLYSFVCCVIGLLFSMRLLAFPLPRLLSSLLSHYLIRNPSI